MTLRTSRLNLARKLSHVKSVTINVQLVHCTSPFILRKHELIHKKSLKCDQCDFAVSTSYQLKLHKQIHFGERPSVCDQCGKSFLNKRHLKQHKAIHSGVKPYSCDQCEFSSYRIKDLNRHNLCHISRNIQKKRLINANTVIMPLFGFII